MRWKEFAVKEARQTLAAWEARVGPLKPPIAVEDIADLLYLLAIDVTFDLPRTLAGRLYAEQRIIEVRRSDSPRRQRFTIAHEVGHYRLHVVAKGIQSGSYDCSSAIIGAGDGEGQSPKPIREAPLPGFAAPGTFATPALSERKVRQLEIEANAFAAELLMPAPLVEQAIARYGKDVRGLAEHFDVSLQAMQIRLEKLLLLPPPGPQMSLFGEVPD
ncbi:ImmA/IrrE family metallo-endopeptidase [Oscillochloris sp. ZM17-4]|uniref:ImmA/IrrE family metallo-endopeptidase n=1 Tax=Oscillochloris sp. ZM17-4 TaxID=2866714 RepID=UPI001C732F73|nr:ImmA/IrrE family metallo-endopeptidase [Oscillochloris sp. ZM17-4]MBX0328565.1 ImmA/IrrE family metallo-endopeptidase [Oscillochloris sp. ZM17-4]